MTSIVSCRSNIDSLLFLVSDDEITERSTSDHTVRSTWPAALCIYLLVLWLEDRLTRLLSRTKIDFPALNSTGYLTPFCETPWEEWLTQPLALFGNCVSVLWEYLQLDLALALNVKSTYQCWCCEMFGSLSFFVFLCSSFSFAWQDRKASGSNLKLLPPISSPETLKCSDIFSVFSLFTLSWRYLAWLSQSTDIIFNSGLSHQ